MRPAARSSATRFGERVEADPERRVRRDLAHVRGGEAREESGLADAVVALVGHVERALQEVLGQLLVPRRDDGGEVREGSARRQEAAGAHGDSPTARANQRTTFVSSWTSAGAGAKTPT